MGAPRIWEELRYGGILCSKNWVARLMRTNGIRGIPQKRRWRKKAVGDRPAGIRNHLARDFTATEPNTRWVTDITYIETAEGWLYLSCTGSVRRHRGGLVDESPPDMRAGHAGRAHGTLAA